MIIFKTVLTDKQIEDYKRPEGTKNYDCAGGVNCAFCTLKMLGVYNPELEETSKTCGPRFRAGNMVKPAEYLGAVKRVIADMTDEHHEFVFDQEIGQPSVSLAKVAEYLGTRRRRVTLFTDELGVELMRWCFARTSVDRLNSLIRSVDRTILERSMGSRLLGQRKLGIELTTQILPRSRNPCNSRSDD